MRSMSVSALSRDPVPHQRPNDDARNGSSPFAFACTAHCPHTASNRLPSYYDPNIFGRWFREFCVENSFGDQGRAIRYVDS